MQTYQVDMLNTKFRGKMVRIYTGMNTYLEGLFVGGSKDGCMAMVIQSRQATLKRIPLSEVKLIMAMQRYSFHEHNKTIHEFYMNPN